MRQENNTAAGHIAGRDINIYAPCAQVSALSRLFTHLKSELKEDQNLCAYISELEVFTRTVKDENVVGLNNKLHEANRDDQIDMALHMKEIIFSKLRANIFSPTFQLIYATLMGKVFEEFETWVKPAILRKEERDVIDQLLNTKVIRPIVDEVEACGDYQGVAPQTIRGMVYFLTGNCHIRWH